MVAAANWRPESLAKLAEAFAIPRTTTDWRELVGDPGIDAVVVATPNSLHAEQAIAFLEAGQHVLVEKPMAMDVAEADAMVAAAERSERVLMVAHCWRFHPDVIALRDRIAAGELGEVVKTRGYGVHAKWGPSGWFVDPALAGGGALADMGVHAIDTARFLLGGPEPARVCAAVGTRYSDHAVDDDADPSHLVVERHELGRRVGLVAAAPGRPRGRDRGLRHRAATRGSSASPSRPSPATSTARSRCTPAQMAEFCVAIREGREPTPTGADGRIVMQVVEDAYRSAAVLEAR